MIEFGYGVLMRASVLMSVLLYVHQKMTYFPSHFPFPFTNVVTSLVDFVTACKSLQRLCVIAGTADSKNPRTLLLRASVSYLLKTKSFWPKVVA